LISGTAKSNGDLDRNGWQGNTQLFLQLRDCVFALPYEIHDMHATWVREGLADARLHYVYLVYRGMICRFWRLCLCAVLVFFGMKQTWSCALSKSSFAMFGESIRFSAQSIPPLQLSVYQATGVRFFADR
jgi:hypothetical protein